MVAGGWLKVGVGSGGREIPLGWGRWKISLKGPAESLLVVPVAKSLSHGKTGVAKKSWLLNSSAHQDLVKIDLTKSQGHMVFE